MSRLILSVPLSPWHEVFCAIGVRRSLLGAAIVPNATPDEDRWATRVVWFAGVAFGLVYPRR